jgi:ribosomal protein S12 methylthiotransferase
MLVGYPGETEADFEELLAFVREARFERLGVFPYSGEEGTFSHSELADDVPEEEKNRRVERLMELQAEISAELNAARVGTRERVIVDRREGGFWVCRSRRDSPEVDGEILVEAGPETGGERGDKTAPETGSETGPDAISSGDFLCVEIVSAGEYDLFAKIIS